MPLRPCQFLARLLALWLCLAAAAGAAETFIVGPANQPLAFVEALQRAKDGDTIEVLPGEYKGVVASITHRKLTIRGVGQRPVFIAGGKAAEAKAIFVVRDGDITIENIEFREVRVPDGNGAGIRFEKGKLTLRRCAFLDNEIGVLTANFGDAELHVIDSEFGIAPRVVGGLNHLLYVGRIGKLTIEGSRFFRGFEGHMIKSRARESVIAYNMIRDGNDGGSSYQIDLSNGGKARLIGNIISKGVASQNPVLVAYGTEGAAWDDNELVLAHNTLISEGWRPAWFVRVLRDRVPDVKRVLAVNNLVVGGGIFRLGLSGDFQGNWPATLGMLQEVATGAFELPPDSWLRGRAEDPRAFSDANLVPQFEFQWPVGTRAIPTDRARWAPGAYQR